MEKVALQKTGEVLHYSVIIHMENKRNWNSVSLHVQKSIPND